MIRLSRQGQVLVWLLLGAFAWPAEAQQDTGDDIDTTAYNYPVVITPTRLRQSVADVPASVTIITRETLQRHGITNIPDALRMVPGMAVTQSTGNDFRINYHGTDVVAPRRMNVLIDGFAVYGAALSRVEWVSIPVVIDDVDRIEVTRGPDSAAYGPNSMTAVVNIITRNPRDVERAMVSFGGGSHHAAELNVRLATRLGDSTHAALMANIDRRSGYDNSTLPGGAHDSSRLRRLNLRTHTDFSNGNTLELNASHVSTDRDISYAADPFSLEYPDLTQKDSKLSAKWTLALSASHELQLRALAADRHIDQDWRTCWPMLLLHPAITQVLADNPLLSGAFLYGSGQPDLPTLLNTYPLSPSDRAKVLTAILSMGGVTRSLQPSCGVSNADYRDARAQIELQDTFVVSDSLRVVSGFGLRKQSSEGITFLSSKVENTVHWFFAHGEYRHTPDLSFNVGGYHETNSLSGNSFSPRVAANYRLSPSQTVRAVFSRGTRSPDMLELRGNWAPAMEDLAMPVDGKTNLSALTVLRGNAELKEERNTAVELGHMLAVRNLGLVIDTRVFQERMSNLISSYWSATQPLPTNNGSVRLSGAETQWNWDLTGSWSGWLAYSYLVNHGATNNVERTQWSRHSGSAGISHQFDDSWQSAFSTYWSSGNGFHETRYGRSDLTVSHAFRLSEQTGSVSLTASYLHTPFATTFLASRGEFVGRYDDRLGLYGKVRLSF
jgi:iron complex outermembrane recepter protein